MKIDEYDLAKSEIVKYMAEMDEIYELNNKVIEKYGNDIFSDDIEDLQVAIKFCRTWNIVKNELSVSDRNLFILYQISNRNIKRTLEYFNAIGKNYKNTATLTVIICNIKKKIKELFKEKYGV